MRKFLKFVGIALLALVALFVVWCFIPEDEEDENVEVANSSVVDNSGSFEQAKQEMISSGVIREPQVKLKGNGEDTATVLIYMNGSNLESDDGEATIDISEMIEAGSSDKVNVIIQTMGTKKWDSKFGIASDHTQRYMVGRDGLTLVDDSLGQLDCTVSETLEDYIKWGVTNFPADRYMLVLWNHGAGPIYGFGYDEWRSEDACLGTDELQDALRSAGVYFDFIGMDCCIMSCMEVGCALYDYCDYLVLSEDFESSLGWSYKEWLEALYDNTSIHTVELGKVICDSMVSANEDDWYGDESIMAVIDTSMMKILYTTWVDFAYANEGELLGTNYSQKRSRKIEGGRIHPVLQDYSRGVRTDNPNMSEYYVTDIMAVAQNIDSAESEALSAAVSKTLLYVRATKGDSSLTGISVTLPYGDNDFYKSLKSVFGRIGIDNDYITWLGKFTSVTQSTSSYDYTDWSDAWDGMEEYEDDYSWDDWSFLFDEEYWDDDDIWGWDDGSCYDDDGYYYEDYYDDSYSDYYCYDDDDYYYEDNEDYY